MATETKPRTASRQERDEAAFWAAIAASAKAREAKGLIHDGAKHLVEVSIDGTVDGREVSTFMTAGNLTKGHATPYSSTKAVQGSQLIAVLLDQIPRKQRERFVAELPRIFADNDCQLPPVDPVIDQQAEKLLKTLVRKTTVTRAGSVSFQETGGA